MTTKRKKSHLLIGFLATFVLPCMGIAIVAGLTNPGVLTVCAVEETLVTVPTADYEFTITKSGALYDAACNKALTVSSNNTLIGLIEAIDIAAGTGKVKKLIFNGGTNEESGEGLPLDVGSENCYLISGTYILDGMITGTSANGIIQLANNASLYTENIEIYATSAGRAILNNSSGTINITGGTIRSTNEVALHDAGSGTVNISGGTISSSSSYAIYTSNYCTGNITISQAVGATTLITSDHTDATIQLYSSSRLMITGGTVQNTSSGTVIRNRNTGSIVISGGVVQNISTGTAIYNENTGIITINGTALVTSKNTVNYNGTVYLGNSGGKLYYTKGSITNTAGGKIIYGSATIIIIPTITVLNDVNTMVSIKLSYEKINEGNYNILSESGIRFGATFNTTVYDKAGVLVIPTRLLGSNADIKEYFNNVGIYDAIDNPTSKLVNINAENTVEDTTLFFAGVIYNYPETRFGEELAVVCYYEHENVMYLSKQIVTSFVKEAQWYLANVTSLTADQIAVLQIIAAK